MEHGERRTFLRGETLEEAGEPAQWVAFVERGCFKYMVHNDEEGKDYCTGFAFEGEFVTDFPYCLDGDVSEVSIEADMSCKVCIISGRELQELFDSDPKMMLHNVRILKNLFKMVYGRDLDHYCYTARSRYRRLIDRQSQQESEYYLQGGGEYAHRGHAELTRDRKADVTNTFTRNKSTSPVYLASMVGYRYGYDRTEREDSARVNTGLSALYRLDDRAKRRSNNHRGHGDRYIGSLFRGDEPVPDDSGAAQWPRARCPRSQSLADVIPLRFLRFPYQSWRQR